MIPDCRALVTVAATVSLVQLLGAPTRCPV